MLLFLNKLDIGVLLKLCVLVHFVEASQYFVQLKSPSTFEALLKSDDTVEAIHHLRPLIYKSISFGTFEGFSGDFDSDVLERLGKNPLVEEITKDIVVKTCEERREQQIFEPVDLLKPVYSNVSSAYNEFDIQYDAPRHLARLSSRYNIYDEDDELTYKFPADFQGESVNAYVIDTGISCNDPEFEARCTIGEDFTGEGSGDNNGHGTHVAGILGSKTYGVAKKINIIEVKALDKSGTGSLSSIISGIEFAVNHYRDYQAKNPDNPRKAVINLSIGAFRNAVLNKAVEVAYRSGLVLVAAAGNSNVDACTSSPASAKYAITVGAIDDRNDRFASFSNWGRCVNILASGVKVASVNSKSYNYPLILSGTSMSTPSVCGLVAILLESGVEPQDVKRKLKEVSTVGAVPKTSLLLRPITPNRVAYMPFNYIQSKAFQPFKVELTLEQS